MVTAVNFIIPKTAVRSSNNLISDGIPHFRRWTN